MVIITTTFLVVVTTLVTSFVWTPRRHLHRCENRIILLYFSFQANEIRVKLGEYDFEQSGETGDATFHVANMKMHENYNDVTYDNDIAIIKLDRPATFSKSIWPICLPPPQETFENRRAFVIGESFDYNYNYNYN